MSLFGWLNMEIIISLQEMPLFCMEIKTHLSIDKQLCGQVVELGEGRAVVNLMLTPNMSADKRGLVHGGFIFGLADYAAMLAVNDPNVVLGAAETRFLKPCQVGETIEANAQVVGDVVQ